MPITLVAILTVRKDALEQFRAFETHAARVMKKHGGRIERSIVVAAHEASELMKEVHVLTFPNVEAFAAYRADPQLARFAHLRDQAVVDTELLTGEDGPSYDAS